MPSFIALVGVLALALTIEITGHTETKPPTGPGLSTGRKVGLRRGEHAVVAPVPRASIALVLDTRLPASVSRSALEEAAAIWAPYGVIIASPEAPPSSIVGPTVDRTTGDPQPATGDCVSPLSETTHAALTVDIEDTTVGTGVLASPFASIRFLNGVPETTIRLHYGNLTKLGLATLVLDGAREDQWPRTLREQVLARMIGRVIAHEIGHWLLGTRGHSATGLMRAVQGVSELAEPGRTSFRLDPGDVVRLKKRVER